MTGYSGGAVKRKRFNDGGSLNRKDGRGRAVKAVPGTGFFKKKRRRF